MAWLPGLVQPCRAALHEAPAERLAVNEAEKGDETGHCIVQRVSVVMTNKGRKASGGWWLMTVKVRERAEDGEG